MSLEVSYVARLDEVLDPVVAFLSRDTDLFAKPRIVVPSAGAKAWLLDALARRLGASDAALADGVFAHVDLAFPGTITALVQPVPDPRAPDPWSIDRLTFAVLDLITSPAAADLGIPGDCATEPLLTARRIAGLFDAYHVRRPGMILLWEKGRPALSPVATPRDPEGSGGELAEPDLWQFRTWRRLRADCGTPSPPARSGIGHRTVHQPLLVVGLQSLSLEQITGLQALGTACDVRVLLVHPSPPLRERWAAGVPGVSPGVPPKREPPELAADLDPLVAAWLHGARETQALLASQGIRPAHAEAAIPPHRAGDPLLARMRRTVVAAVHPTREPHDPRSDRSLTVHCCHSLARQAEVVHDAILHACTELEDLQPHEVAIVSPCLPRLAPHLEAVFDRNVAGANGARVKLPLVIADRGLHEVSTAAELLLELLGLVGSRGSVEQFRTLAVHPLVRRRFTVDDDATACWDRLVERTRIHWGFDPAHRLREGFPEAAAAAHTWQAGLERMLLGAVLPDAAPAVGDAVPLEHVSLTDLAAIQTLIRIFEVVRGLHAAAATSRPVAAWCDALEEALFALCGAEAAELVEPLGVLRGLRAAASATPVPFTDVREVLADALRSAGGRQPFRTGAITATSMVPLRDVPFRVVCVVGYDDGTVTVADARGDDLAARQSLAGDGDPRLELRRTLLDCLLAARDRLVITCNGSDIRNNKPLPLVTPLAELVDFAVRHGVARPDPAKRSGIEVVHPRHAVGSGNFRADGVQPGLVWSHDAAAGEVSRDLGHEEPRFHSVVGTLPALPVVEVPLLEALVRDPLGLYVQKALGISTWTDDAPFPEATFPLALTNREARELTQELLERLVAGGDDEERRTAEWIAAVRAAGRLPFGRFGDLALREIRQLATGIRDGAAAARQGPIPLAGFESVPVRIPMGERLLTGTLTGVHRDTRQLVDVRVTRGDRGAWGLPLHVAGLRLLAATAAGLALDRAVVVARHEKWVVDAATPAMIARTLSLAAPLRAPAAATARLAALCGLLPRAMASPCGRFGGTWERLDDDAAAAEAFAAWLNRDHAGSTEEIVYGARPQFADVFARQSPERAFHEEFRRLFTITRGYELS